MELSELRKTPHLSASAVSDYLDCSLMYKFGRIDKIKAAFTPDALEFGLPSSPSPIAWGFLFSI